MPTQFEDFLQAAKQYQTIPLTDYFFLDMMTPIQIFQRLKDNACFLLESKDDASPWSRYSFIGVDPQLILREEGNRFVTKDRQNQVVVDKEHFRDALNETIRLLNPQPTEIPLPFYGGGVGYISYDGISEFDPTILPHANNDLAISRFYFSFCELILAYDHVKKELIVIQHVFVNQGDDEETLTMRYKNAKAKMKKVTDLLLERTGGAALFQMPKATDDVSFAHVRSNFHKDDFLDAVEKVKASIAQGDVEQVVISQRFELELNVSGLDVYRVLRIINPSPYLFYIKIDDFEIVGSSPERLVQVNDQNVEIHPIAGTRKRGKTEEEDNRLATELLNDEKERAEHQMLVELAKREIESVAEKGSVNVPSYMEIGFFSHVMHIISKVRGTLRRDIPPIDALIAAFPAGTLSGAPKPRAMEMIRDIEPAARGVYGGAIGYIGFDGNIDSCITIRSMLIKDNTAYVQAGAGIVADSVPEKEWQETRNKAKALIKAIEIAKKLFQSEGVHHV